MKSYFTMMFRLVSLMILSISVLCSAHAEKEVKKTKILIGDSQPYIQGVWFWNVNEGEFDQVKDFEGVEPQGVFLLELDKGGVVKGVSVIEAPLADNTDKMKSVIYKSPVTGKAKKNSDGTSSFQFSVKTDGGSLTTSVATIAKDGRSMTGSSDSTIKRVDGSSIKVSYAWTAKRP